MLNLIFAPNAELLVSLVHELVRKVWNDPFEPPSIIVPNPAVGKWLSMKLALGQPLNLSGEGRTARGFECVANARFVTLEKFLWNALEPPQNTGLLDADKLSQIIEALLDKPLLNNGIYKPIRNYLCPNGGTNKIDALKRVQLSAKIASLFLEYEYNRPSVWNEKERRWSRKGIDAKWLSGENYFENRLEHEAWQKDLYQKVYGCFNKCTKTAAATLPHLYRKKRETGGKEKTPFCKAESRIILFNVSKISHFHRNTLVEISQMNGVELHLFLTNPCAEFWEDVDTDRKRAARVQWSYNSPDKIAAIKPRQPDDYDKSEFNLFEYTNDHALLKLWGGAGKENIYLWCPQAEWNFEYHCPGLEDGTPPRTLLQSLQKSLLTRQNDLDVSDVTLKTDRSLQILAAPDQSREVEELRELILDMVHNKKIGAFDETAVYIPNPQVYEHHILRVFGAYSHNDPRYIPFTILGESGGSSLVNQGVRNLLNIMNGQFNRRQIFEFFRNPIVQKSANFSLSMVCIWERWAQELGMYRGFNASGRKRMGDKGEAVTDLHTFQYGLNRLKAAVSAAKRNDTDFSGGSAPPPPPYYREITEYEEKALETFCVLLKELDELSDEFTGNGSALNISEAVELTKRAVRFWFGSIPNNERVNGGAEEKTRQELLEGIERIALQQTVGERENISPEEFTAAVETCLSKELPPPSNWNGITFAPLKQSLIVPHRAVFVLGLDAAAFPGTNEKGSWDLLSKKRIVGDSDSVKENRFAFLELIHAAKESLVLSYRARDMQKDEILQPSSVVLELEDYLINQGVSEVKNGETRCSVRREIPWVVHESLNIPILAGREHGTWDKTEHKLAAQCLNARIAHRHDTQARVGALPYDNINDNINPLSKSTQTEINDGSRQALQTVLFKDKSQYVTDIKDMKRFLSNPLEYHLYRTLGIGPDDDRDDMSQSDEPLLSGFYLARLRKELWSACLELLFPQEQEESRIVSDTQALERQAAKIAGKIYENHIVSGRAPEGYLCRMERDELTRWSKECAGAAFKLLSVFTNHKLIKNCDFSMGRENKHCFLTVTDGSAQTFSINGSHSLALVPKTWENRADGAAIIGFNKDVKVTENHELWLEGIIQYIYENESADALPLSLVQLNHDKPDVQISQMKINPQKTAEIIKWAETILKEMLMENNCEHLPFKVIQEIMKPDNSHSDLNERLEKLNINTFKDKLTSGKFYRCYMDAFNLTDARPPQFTDTELRETAARRFAPILDIGGWTDE